MAEAQIVNSNGETVGVQYEPDDAPSAYETILQYVRDGRLSVEEADCLGNLVHRQCIADDLERLRRAERERGGA